MALDYDRFSQIDFQLGDLRRPSVNLQNPQYVQAEAAITPRARQ
jgi:hypothetical protein